MTTAQLDRSTHLWVRFQGRHYVWLKQPDGTGLLAPPNHIDQDGCVRHEALFCDSYAHVSDGRVVRSGEEVGRVSDFVFLPWPRSVKEYAT